MSRRALFRIAAIVLPLALAAVVAELALRHHTASEVGTNQLVHRAAADPVLVYEFTPGARAEFDGIEFAINSSGFRDDEFRESPLGTRRIVVAGDSVATGWGVAMRDAFPQVLERELGDAVVFNLSVDGYSTRQELRLLESPGLALRPDLIVLSYSPNDPDEQDGGLARHYGSRIELWELLRRGLRSVFESMQDLPREYHHRIHARNAAATAEQFRALGQFSRDHRVSIVVAVTPVFRGSLGADYAWRDIHDRLAELCRTNGLQFLDLRTALAGVRDAEIAIDLWHPSAHGHRVIAKSLADFIHAQR